MEHIAQRRIGRDNTVFELNFGVNEMTWHKYQRERLEHVTKTQRFKMGKPTDESVSVVEIDRKYLLFPPDGHK